MKNVNKLKKEGYLGLTHTWGQKPLKIWGGKWQKKLGLDQSREKRMKKKEKYLKKWRTREVKKLFFFFFIPFEIRSFEYQSGTNRTNRDQSLKNKGFSIDQKTCLIDRNSRKQDFLKNSRSLCKKHSIQIISWMKCMRMSFKVFQKHQFSTQKLQNKVFNHQKHKFCQPLNIFCIKHHRKHNLGWPN